MEAKNLTDHCHDDVSTALAALPAHIENTNANPQAALTPIQKANFVANAVKILQYLVANLPQFLTLIGAAAAPVGAAPMKASDPKSGS
jgi:hypothetical protein